ncbi:hypothetical protein B5F40_07100 [Gordonibacter sp. An230]|nr:hypothetical protein B5F40_07100 [Gordonibacter sp. An230]
MKIADSKVRLRLGDLRWVGGRDRRWRCAASQAFSRADIVEGRAGALQGDGPPHIIIPTEIL